MSTVRTALVFAGIVVGFFALDAFSGKPYVQSGICKVTMTNIGAHTSADIQCKTGREFTLNGSQLASFAKMPEPGDSVTCSWTLRRGLITKRRYWIQGNTYQCQPFTAPPQSSG